MRASLHGSMSCPPPPDGPKPLPPRRRRLARALLVACAAFAAGGLAGFLAFTRALPALLERQAVPALSAALGGPVSLGSLRPALRFGLAFEGEALEAWPDAEGPALRVETLLARLSIRALLRREIEIRAVELEGVRLRLARDATGRVEPEAALRLARGAGDTSELSAGATLARLQVVVRDAQIELRDAVGPGAIWRAHLEALSLRGHRGRLDLAFDVALARGADPSRPDRPLGRIEVKASRAADGALAATLAAADVDLATLAGVRDLSLPAGLAGRVDAVVDATLPAPQGQPAADAATPGVASMRGELDLDVRGEALRVPVALGSAPRDSGAALLAFDDATFSAHAAFAPGGLQLRDAKLLADGHELSGELRLARPLDRRATLSVSLALPELRPELLRRIAGALPARIRPTLESALARVETGSLRTLALRGAAPLERWAALVGGEAGAWTRGFSVPPELSLEVADLALRLEDGHRLTDVGGRLAWRGDRLEIRELSGRLDGDPTDELDVDLDGIAALAQARSAEEGLGTAAEALPGRRPLARILGQPPGQTDPGWKQLTLEIDWLAHALLLWPIREARAVATPRVGGFHVVLERARWGGVDLHGEGDVFDGPPDRIAVSLAASGGAGSSAPAAQPSGDAARQSWARGRYELELVPRGDDRVRSAAGYFRAGGSHVRLFESEVALTPGGRLRGEADFELSRDDDVPYTTRFTFDEATMSDLMALLGRPDPAFRGRVEGSGELVGRLAPGSSPLAGARGTAQAEARDGEVPTRVPLFLYLASASAGLNPFASRDRIPFRKLKGNFVLADDRVSTENLLLKGPDMRIAMSGSLGVFAPNRVDGVIGVAVQGNVTRTIGAIPIVNYLVLGKDKSLVSLWFRLEGPWDEARTTLIPVKSLALGPAGMVTEGLPRFVERGIDALSALLGRSEDDVEPPNASSPSVGDAPEGFAQ